DRLRSDRCRAHGSSDGSRRRQDHHAVTLRPVRSNPLRPIPRPTRRSRFTVCMCAVDRKCLVPTGQTATSTCERHVLSSPGVDHRPPRQSPTSVAVSNQAAIIRLIIAGEHSIFRHGLRRLLEGEAGLSIIREIADGAAAVSLVRELTPDILLLGLTHSKHPPIETLKSLANCTTTRTIVLTDRLDRAEVLSAVQLGVRAVVLKDS